MDTVNVLSRSHTECTELLFGTVYNTSVMQIILRFGFVMLVLINTSLPDREFNGMGGLSGAVLPK